MKTCKLHSNTKISTQDIVNSLIKSLDELSEERFVKSFTDGDNRITILILEQYYYRSLSDLSITLIVNEQPDYTAVEVVSCGGKVSNAFGFWRTSWGAEKSAINSVADVLIQMGFEKLQEQ